MRRLLLIYIVALVSVAAASAQRITRSFNNVPMPDALQQINSMTRRYTINFIFNDLEDFRVTTDVDAKTVPEAVKRLIGFYPITMTLVGDSVITVECDNKTARRYKGRIVDENGNALEFVNVALLSPADSTLLSGGVSNASGYFVVPCEAQRVVARISCVGYKTLFLLKSQPDIGLVKMKPDSRIIREVEVKSTLPHTQLKGEGMTTTVSGTVLERAGDVYQLLNLIPFVSVRNENIEVLGRGTPEIYINGRKMTDAQEVRRLQSDDIKSVEVITNPGARYAAGTRSVIRITAKRPSGDGFGVDAQSFVSVNEQSRMSYTDVLRLSYHRGKFDLSANLYGSYTHSQGNRRLEQNTYLADTWRQSLRLSQEYTNANPYARLAASYQINDSNSVGLSLSDDHYAKLYASGGMQAPTFRNGEPYETTTSSYTSPGHSSAVYSNAYYVGRIGSLGIDFNTDYYWYGAKNIMRTHETSAEASAAASDRTVSSDRHNYNYLLASKLVLAMPLLKGSLSVGGEYSSAKRKMIYGVEPLGLVDNENSIIRERMTSAFADYSHAFGSLSLQAGLRYEYTDFKYYDSGTLMPSQSRLYAKWFPSVALAWQVGRSQMQLTYAHDIQRPSYSNLRNGVQYDNHYTYETGNPFLVPSISRNLTLAFSWQWLTVQAVYTHTSDGIFLYMRPYNDDPTTALSRPENTDGYNTFGLNASLSPSFGVWHPSLEASLTKSWFKMDIHGGHSLHNPLAQFKFNNMFDFRHFTATLTLNANTEGNVENTHIDRCALYTGLVLSKKFLHDRLELRLAATDLLHTADTRYTFYSGTQRSTVMTIRSSSTYSFTLRYKFNVGRNRYKGTGAGQSQRNRM